MMMKTRTTALVFGCALLAAACDLTASDSDAAEDADSEELGQIEATSELERIAGLRTGVRVMTQNLYVGLDVFPIIAAPLEEVPFAVAEGFADLLANRPEDRMAAIANEIALVRPHLVGLQEVTRLFTQFPSDTVLGNFTPNATDQQFDYLATLQDELAARGLDYEVAAEQQGTDIELPRFDGVVDGNPSFTDVRVQFSDVILRRADVPATLLVELNYQTALPIPQIPDMFVRRNLVGVLATVDGDQFRFFSTHLEPLIPGVPDTSQPQLGQVVELVQLLATSFEPDRETILIGDFNSPAETGTSYQAIAGAGYTDVWNERSIGSGPGFTCCQDVILTHSDSRLFERIDLMWTSNLSLKEPVLASTIGDQSIFRTRTKPRLWPSDHAGVVSWLRF
jgi:endonuclease/exonuclease/phosphatase family metal-dependent hydrolase